MGNNIFDKFNDRSIRLVESFFLKQISKHIKSRRWNPDASFAGSDDNLFVTDKGKVALFQLKRRMSISELWDLLKFSKQGGKIICLPMFAGIPADNYVDILSASGYTSDDVPEQIKSIPHIPLGDMDFHSSLSRSFPGNKDEKKYDFINCTWAENYREKRFDLTVDLVVKLCVKYKMILFVYKNKISSDSMARLQPFIDNGNLILNEGFVEKEEFSQAMRQSRVGIVNSEWDARPRYLDQLLLCDIPVCLNKNIYGGQKFVVGGSGEVCSPEDMAKVAVAMLKNVDSYNGIRARYLKKHGVYNSARELTVFLNNLFSCNDKVIIPKSSVSFFRPDYINKIQEDVAEDCEFFPFGFFDD